MTQDVPQGIRIIAQKAEKGEPFPSDGPPGSRVVYDEEIYRTWYKRFEGVEQDVLHYAESKDRYEWGRQTACEFDWRACPEAEESERPDLFIDPSAPEQERFKMFFRSGIRRTDADKRSVIEAFARTRPNDIYPAVGESLDYLAGMFGAVSPDGIHWKAIPGPLVIHYSDTTNVVYYNGQFERYVWYAQM